MKRNALNAAAILLVLGVVLLVTGCGDGSTRTSSSTERLRLELTSPNTRGSVTEAETTITGVVSEPAATVTVNDATVTVGTDGSFTRAIPLEYGSNRIAIRATAEGFSDTSRTVTITRNLTLDLTFPADDMEVSQDQITVTGTVSDPNATIRVQGYLVPVGTDGKFAQNLTLHYPSTIIAVVASVAGREPISQNVTLTYPQAQ